MSEMVQILVQENETEHKSQSELKAKHEYHSESSTMQLANGNSRLTGAGTQLASAYIWSKYKTKVGTQQSKILCSTARIEFRQHVKY